MACRQWRLLKKMVLLSLFSITVLIEMVLLHVIPRVFLHKVRAKIEAKRLKLGKFADKCIQCSGNDGCGRHVKVKSKKKSNAK